MAFANSSITDVMATTIEYRSRKIADNVTNSNALLARLQEKGRIRPFSGGTKIIEEIAFAENPNFGWYSGYDLLPVSAADVLSGAEYPIKQCACPVTISGLERLQNSGREALIDLLEARLNVAESTMANNIQTAIYSDGTGSGGKQLTGLAAAIVANPATGTYGGIDRATWTFWRNQYTGSLGAQTTATILANMNSLWASLVRGSDKPDLIIMGSSLWGIFMGALQPLQQFVNSNTANAGFVSLKYMGADVVLDTSAPSTAAYFLNTNYIFLRPHRDRNMVPLTPQRRVAINQDAEVQILAWAGNLTMSGSRFQGYFQGS
jgi:hypothetical protein